MVFNATFNNISVISWWSVFLVEETWMMDDGHKIIRKVHLAFARMSYNIEQM
jgi:hypothetical protein